MKLNQSVFEGAPDWAEWAAIQPSGFVIFSEYEMSLVPLDHSIDHFLPRRGRFEVANIQVDWADWQNSLIRRDRCGSCPNKTDGVCCGSAK